jgi:hypothetical protein
VVAMPKLKARSGHGSRYALNPAPREIAPCLGGQCPGTLVVGTADDETVIACTFCDVTWPRLRWLELADLMES